MFSSVIYRVVVFIQSCFFCAVIDTTIFLCVDKICKILLTGCTSVSERRDIWLIESIVLFLLSSVVFVFHHYPLLLWLLGLITFISATLTGRVDFGFYWESLKNYWNEFSDQQDNLTLLPDETNGSASTGMYKNQVSEDQCREYMRQTGDVQISTDNAVGSAGIGEGLQTLRYNEKKAKYELVGPTQRRPSKGSRNRRASSSGHSTAKHHGDTKSTSIVTQAVDVPEADSPGLMDHLEVLGSKVWSVLGLAADSVSAKRELPPGLPSSGSNLCFLNSVLQCIARAPNLADELAEEVKSCRLQDPCRLALLDAVTEVLQQINVMNSDESASVVDTRALCQAGSQLNPDLLMAQRSYQTQQDAAECLNWLLQEIHEAINEAKGQQLPGLQDEPMRKLKAVYGNMSEPYTKVMKQECKTQIAAADGFTDAELPELVQNLANLEWITHRRTHRSVIDDLFTFQCIELQMCSSCNRTSVNVQSMSILSLPIPNQQMPVQLSACFTDFIARERLVGRDGLQCSRCQVSCKPSIAVTPAVQTRQASRLQSEPLSPIRAAADATALHQNTQFLASTPLHSSDRHKQSAPITFSTKTVTEGIRQCLLRRLPECLTIQLLRFNYETSSKRVRKIYTAVNVPLKRVELGKLTYDSIVEREDITTLPNITVYSLYALILHIGADNTNSGHYMSYCRGLSGRWYQFDDDKVFIVRDIETELAKTQVKENCYLLFYRKDHETDA